MNGRLAAGVEWLRGFRPRAQADLSRSVRRVAAGHAKLDESITDVRKSSRDQHHRLEEALAGLSARFDGLNERLDALAEQTRVSHAMARQLVELAMCNMQWRGRLDALAADLDVQAAAAHVQAAVDASRLEPDPYPHVVISEVLPRRTYDALIACLPPPAFFEGREGRRTKREVVLPMRFGPDATLLAADLLYRVTVEALVPALLRKFGPVLRDYMRAAFPGGQYVDDIVVEKLNNIRETRIFFRGPGYSLDPHRDPKWAFVSCLIYLARPQDQEAFGTNLYAVEDDAFSATDGVHYPDPARCRVARTVPFRANTALAFLNGLGAHGANLPADVDPATERYIYSVRFGPHSATRAQLSDQRSRG